MKLLSCCLCFSLETGAYIFAALGTILNILVISIDFHCLNIIKTAEALANDHWVCNEEDLATITISTTACILSLGFTGLMVAGVYKRQHRYIAPWLVLCLIEMAFIVIEVIKLIIDAAMVGSAVFGTTVFALGTACFMFTLYNFAVVLQVYRDIKAGPDVGRLHYNRQSLIAEDP